MEINYEKFNRYELLFILQMEIDFLNCFFDTKDLENCIRTKGLEDEFASFGFYDSDVEYDDEEYPNFIQDYFLKDIDDCIAYKNLFLETFKDLLDGDFHAEYEEEKSYLDNFFSDELEADYLEGYIGNLDMFYKKELLRSVSSKNLEKLINYLKSPDNPAASLESISIKNLEKEFKSRK